MAGHQHFLAKFEAAAHYIPAEAMHHRHHFLVSARQALARRVLDHQLSLIGLPLHEKPNVVSIIVSTDRRNEAINGVRFAITFQSSRAISLFGASPKSITSIKQSAMPGIEAPVDRRQYA